MVLDIAVLAVVLGALPFSHGLAREGGVGRLPALGWNSWNAFGCNVDEAKILTAANNIVSLGLKDVGYEYVNIDDCWSVITGRDNVTHQIIPDPTKFPDGISGTVAQIHALGLKSGIYSSAGTETCGGYPASIGFEEIDAATFASWGIDYLKYDNCGVPANWTDEFVACVPDSSNGEFGPFPNGTCTVSNTTAPADYNWATSNTAQRYRNMRDALLNQNRTILFSLCEWGQADVEVWGNATGNSWRMSGDITPNWGRVAEILNENSFQLNAVGFTGHNDADMLEIGNGNLTLPESRSHFAFWAAMKSPLIIGTELDILPADHVAILANKGLLAFSQDSTFGAPATPFKWGVNPDWTFNATNPAEYWSGESEKGILVLMLNTEAGNETRGVEFSEVPELEETVKRVEAVGGGGNSKAAFLVENLWTGESLGCVESKLEVVLESHDTAAFLVGKACEAKSFKA